MQSYHSYIRQQNTRPGESGCLLELFENALEELEIVVSEIQHYRLPSFISHSHPSGSEISDRGCNHRELDGLLSDRVSRGSHVHGYTDPCQCSEAGRSSTELGSSPFMMAPRYPFFKIRQTVPDLPARARRSGGRR